MFHELANSPGRFWTATKVAFSQLESPSFRARICRYRICEIEYSMLTHRWRLDALEGVDRTADGG